MKHLFLIALCVSLFTSVTFAQSSDSKVGVGDVFTIGEVENNHYEHINFPKNNFIVKKGGVADYQALVGEKVEITSLKEKKDGMLVATIKLASDKKFFMSHKYLTVDINEAISSKELL
ncbi:hypothetical protein KDU71_19770 [Carboxylicivirga sediminis]|uniref:Dihydroorotase n=1 Tax=Carboxylicivirga sediminis TaxID=2006564 RepID=A0A941FA64_9BACT|nr:hypothetical protein [Carboxylicivirga sediminis]MBR8537820.1 hypothetical protein [Carboxylicivirga sediminis]